MQGNGEERSKEMPGEAGGIERRLSAIEDFMKEMQASDDAIAMHVAQMRDFIGRLSAAGPV